MPECPVDGREVQDTVLCRGCVDSLKAELRAVPWLVEQLDLTLTRQARVGSRNGPRSTERPLPFHPRASVDLETLRDGLSMWAAAVAERRQVAVDAVGAVALAGWLLRWAGEVAQHPDAGELHGDVLAMTEAARRTIDLPAERKYVGPCDDCGEDLYCGVLAKVVTCRTEGCEFTSPVEERRTWLLEAAVDQLRTAAELSRELPWIGGVTIDRKLINSWSSRGRIVAYLPHPRDPYGRTRFRLGEVLTLARETAMERADRAARVAG